jgi:hypothetical protein
MRKLANVQVQQLYHLQKFRSGLGCRKNQKVGGGGVLVLRGTFGIKRAPKKFFPEMLAGGGGRR